MIKIQPLKDAQVYSKVYGGFRGCDFTTDPAEIDDTRSPDTLNMISDDAGFPQKRIGWRVVEEFAGKIYGLHYAHFSGVTNPVIIVHHGNRLTAYDFTAGTKTQILAAGMASHDSHSFFHGNYLYLLDGTTFRRLTYSSGYVISPVSNDAKVPTTGVGGHYEAEDDGNGNITYTWVPCTLYEEPNLLSSSQVNLMAGDGVNTDFWLTERDTTITKVEIYSGSPATWAETSAYTKTEDTTVGKTKIAFTSAPAAHPDGAGIDNIRVTFTSSEHPQQVSVLNRCTVAAPYGYFNDNRVFITGNTAYKNRDWACGVDDPTYWELNQWTDVGSDHTAIMGYLHYGDVLAIVKEDDNQDAEIYIRSAVVQSDNKIMFPVQQGVKGVGAISGNGFASLRDDALFYAREGVFSVAGTDASQQRTVQNRSYFADNRLREEAHKENAVAAVWDSRYLLCFPDSGHCYVADSRLKTGFNESYVYEWFYWENIPARTFLEFDGALYFGTDDGKLCRFNNDLQSMVKYADDLVKADAPEDPTIERLVWINGKPINARWSTKVESFGTIARLKTLTKRGSSIQVEPFHKSSVRISITTDKESEIDVKSADTNCWDFGDVNFADIDFNTMLPPQVVPIGKKVKKFQQMQLTIENRNAYECFGVYGIQLQYAINNYIK